MTPPGSKSGRSGPRRPLDQAALEQLALHYVGRYATSRARLRHYLSRKLSERGWAGDSPADIAHLVERIARLGYLDDAAFATARTATLQRRGYGERRIAQALNAAGIEQDDRRDAAQAIAEGAMAAALRFAQRRKIGPYAIEKADRIARERSFAAMVRAGHPLDIVRSILDAEPGAVPDMDRI